MNTKFHMQNKLKEMNEIIKNNFFHNNYNYIETLGATKVSYNNNKNKNYIFEIVFESFNERDLDSLKKFISFMEYSKKTWNITVTSYNKGLKLKYYPCVRFIVKDFNLFLKKLEILNKSSKFNL